MAIVRQHPSTGWKLMNGRRYLKMSLSSFCVGFCPGSDHQNSPTAPGQISLMTWNIAILITFHTLDIFTCAGRSEGQVTLVGLTKEQRRWGGTSQAITEHNIGQRCLSLWPPRITVPRRGGLEIDTAHDSPYCPEAEDVLKMYCVDQDPEIKDAQLKELERWSEYSFWKCTQEELVFYHDPVGYQPGVHWW